MAGSEKIRVLIVDDIQETRENIRRMLQFDQIIEIIGEARTGKEAISLAQQNKPDVIIMDINMPDMDGLVATETIRKKLPFTQIIILSVQNDPSYMRRAMLAGARDFLAKPPMIDELTKAIRTAGQMAIEERRTASLSMTGVSENGTILPGTKKNLGKIIVVYSPKGGTGCTTVASNLAIALHSEDTKTALIDGSLQFGDVAVFLNEQGRNSILDLAPRVDELDSGIFEDVMVLHQASGVRLLAAPPRPEYADDITSDQFGKLIRYMQRLFSYIVIDTASYLTDVVQTAIDISDIIILIATQDIPSIKSSNLFLSLSSASGIDRSKIMLVMNKFDKRISISPERVGESLHQPVLLSIPLDEKVATTSVNRGTPFILDNKTSPISKSIIDLSVLVQNKIEELYADEIEPSTVKKK
ncbi:MAG: response regulator [Anaerolineaceae bacterium]